MSHSPTPAWQVRGPASDLYRSLFIDVNALAEVARSLAPDAHRIAEIGCDDGSVAEALLAVLPGAAYVGVDVAEPGRLFRGDLARARFASQLSSDLLAESGPGQFDLVVVVDVVHHVADPTGLPCCGMPPTWSRPEACYWSRNGNAVRAWATCSPTPVTVTSAGTRQCDSWMAPRSAA